MTYFWKIKNTILHNMPKPIGYDDNSPKKKY